ncbi:hypothetical protein CSV69_14630 [Sporosarcina sp. P26b]|uniref:DUF5050 domain-containing protein n=1 Tax=Sporosarcina sp. P26b TaxID=2048253 RepID=UPI000C165A6F|nr:DUF5050 domain-containing protein [Sporosarcina sp. P26b]PIC94866.1 hypothetical protein CSV69_14630 [Sporosarcina sp. P26b]
MLNKLLLLPLLIASLVFTSVHPVFATTPNMESYEVETAQITDKQQFSQGNEPYKELFESAVTKSVIPERQMLRLLPNLQLATEWKPLHTTTDAKKPWNITFNQPMSTDEENWDHAKIYDDEGIEFPTIISIRSGRLQLTPNNPYHAGKVYTLVLQKELYSEKGTQLGKDIYQQFIYQPPKTPQKPEITEVTDLYSALYIGLKNMDDMIYVNQYTKDSKVAYAELRKVLSEHPEIFYYEYTGSQFWSDGRLEAKYAYPKETIIRMKANLQREIDTLYATTIKPGMTDYQKVKAVHDYVVLHTAYDYDNFLNDTIPKESYSMYGVLVNKTAVCNGYGLAMVYLLNQLDIETIYVISNPAMNHGWNKVQVDGIWYNLDATWDDPVPNREGKVGYGYFLVSDSQLAKTHSWNNTGLPKATDTRYEYMSRVWTFDTEDGWIYYANNKDDIKLYKMKEDGSENQKIADIRANELVVHDGWIYFSNYSHGGYLFKIRTDGIAKTQITDFLTNDISKDNGTLYFTDSKANKQYRMDL